MYRGAGSLHGLVVALNQYWGPQSVGTTEALTWAWSWPCRLPEAEGTVDPDLSWRDPPSPPAGVMNRRESVPSWPGNRPRRNDANLKDEIFLDHHSMTFLPLDVTNTPILAIVKAGSCCSSPDKKSRRPTISARRLPTRTRWIQATSAWAMRGALLPEKLGRHSRYGSVRSR